jgi:hypothetical protein
VTIISRVAAALQRVLGETAEQSAKDSQAVLRQRKFTGASLVATFVLGFLRKPDARPEELDQKDGRLTLTLESGRDSDAKSALMQTVPDRGSLTIRDLGYFSLDWFAQLIATGAFFISRLQPKTTVFDRDGVPLDLFQLLDQHVGDDPFDRHVLIGQTKRVPCRLIAWRAPADVVALPSTNAKNAPEPANSWKIQNFWSTHAKVRAYGLIKA